MKAFLKGSSIVLKLSGPFGPFNPNSHYEIFKTIKFVNHSNSYRGKTNHYCLL